MTVIKFEFITVYDYNVHETDSLSFKIVNVIGALILFYIYIYVYVCIIVYIYIYHYYKLSQ